jgi:hypothetical protein
MQLKGEELPQQKTKKQYHNLINQDIYHDE